MVDSRSARLLADLSNAFKRDPDIDEFDILPVTEPKQNKSPLVLVEHKLGIELWCVKLFYQYAYETVMEWRRKELHSKILEANELILLTRAILMINPECSTIWNIRKELVEAGDLNLSEDLKFGTLILTKHPKSPETFCHKKWLLQTLVGHHLNSSTDSTGSGCSLPPQDGFINMDAININLNASNGFNMQNSNLFSRLQASGDFKEQLRNELNACLRAGEKHFSNYNAWSHRIWVVKHCFGSSVQVLMREMNVTEKWVSKNISDHSGLQYRQFLLEAIHSQQKLFQEQFAVNFCDLLQKESNFILDLLRSYPGHEALWCHRRYLFHTQHRLKEKESVENSDEELEHKNQKLKRTKLDGLESFIDREINSVNKCELKSSNKHQRTLATKYIEWIKQTYTS